jgi:DNA-binding response OmpR family regulator
VKILFVENHATFAQTVTEAFLGEHDVVLCPSLAAAREAFRTNAFDAALVDFDLDDGKGDVFVRELVAGNFAGTIIAVSSHEFGNDALVSAGAHAKCPKANFADIGRLIATPRERR